jgi:hypothetical protein
LRRPRLDLECLYGAGPVGQPYIYDLHDPAKFLIARSQASRGDLPRNEQGVALVGGARNDTHVFVSQLHLAFCIFITIRSTASASKSRPRMMFSRLPPASCVGTINGSCSTNFFLLWWDKSLCVNCWSPDRSCAGLTEGPSSPLNFPTELTGSDMPRFAKRIMSTRRCAAFHSFHIWSVYAVFRANARSIGDCFFNSREWNLPKRVGELVHSLCPR